MANKKTNPAKKQLSTSEHYDVIVVGAGLVGATVAALLALEYNSSSGEKKPLSIAIVDGGQEPSGADLSATPPEFDARVVALTHASQKIFERLGIWQDIVAQRACAYTDMYVWDDDGTANIHFNAKDIHQSALGHIVENNILLRAVLNNIKQHHHVTCLRNVKVEALEQVEHQGTITLSDQTCLSATLVVAADGGQSKMRELAGISTREWDYQHKAIVATVKSERSHQYTAWQNFLTSGPLAFLPLSDKSEQYCSIVWSLDTEKADALMAVDEQQFSALLGQAFEHRLGRIESISRRFCFPLKQRHALEYHHQHVVLVGDAAHTIHPLAGQGVNLGLLDAQALVQQVSRALDRGLAINEPSVLRRYQRQRKGHNLEVMLLMEGFKRLFGSHHLLVRWLRNTGMKKVNELTLLKNWLAKQAIKND